MILSAQSIRWRCRPLFHSMITPFHDRTVENGMTFGLSPAGYDVRVAEELHLNHGDFLLASTIERFDMPQDLLAYVKDKSSWARQGICVQNTVIEPGWRGFLTLEITMHSRGYIHIPAGSPIAQIVFHMLDEATLHPYAGKYQDQEAGPVEAKREAPRG